MDPILSPVQVREADQYTIRHEPVSSLDLMERASHAFVDKFLTLFASTAPVRVFCGTGNNGGDGLAIARILSEKGWPVFVYVTGNPEKATPDFNANLHRLNQVATWLHQENEFPEMTRGEIAIDALFGSGLSRPLTGLYAELTKHLNNSRAIIVSVDIASGLFADKPVNRTQAIIRPAHTISFQTAKLAFFQPALHPFTGSWHVVPIGLSTSFLFDCPTPYYSLGKKDLTDVLPQRPLFAHKGTFGRLHLIAGSRGKMGAAVLASRAALRTGTGLLFVEVPECGVDIMQVAVPEAMVIENPGQKFMSTFVGNQEATCVAIGPGIGTGQDVSRAFESFLQNLQPTTRLILDADALNLLAQKKTLLTQLPPGTILTPHPGEFERLVGSWDDDYSKLEKLRSLCSHYRLNVVLKGAFSAICDPAGQVVFNTTGNPGMATGGSGDVLLGIVAGWLAQGMAPADALRLGVYVHGLAGDRMAQTKGQESLLASDLIEGLPAAIQSLKPVNG